MSRSMLRKAVVPAVAGVLSLGAVAFAAGDKAFDNANPHSYDPAHTSLVGSGWVNGLGCPTGALVANPNADYTGVGSTSPYTDPACPTGDQDKNNQGLLMAKTGPTANWAAAQVQLTGIKKGTVVSELGFDLRHGSTCGGGAPRWEIATEEGNDWYIDCSTGTSAGSSSGWDRLRWSGGSLVGYDASNGYNFGPVTGHVKSISIVFDLGQDQSPQAMAVLDNIDVNGTLDGQGPHGEL